MQTVSKNNWYMQTVVKIKCKLLQKSHANYLHADSWQQNANCFKKKLIHANSCKNKIKTVANDTCKQLQKSDANCLHADL